MCLATNGSGTVGGTDVSVSVVCTTISGFAYVIGSPMPGLIGYTIASSTGQLTQLTGLPFNNPGAAIPNQIIVSPNGKNLYLTESGTIYVYSITQPPSSQMGTLSLVGSTTPINQVQAPGPSRFTQLRLF